MMITETNQDHGTITIARNLLIGFPNLQNMNYQYLNNTRMDVVDLILGIQSSSL